MVRFYTLPSHERITFSGSLPDGYSVEVWRPRNDGLALKGLSFRKYAVWWLFDRIGLFSNSLAGVIMIKHGRRIVHSSLVTPKWYRFPEMAPGDLQIGDVWTAEDQRGRGLAKIAISEIHQRWGRSFDQMWYIVSDDNKASIRLAKSLGYGLSATGVRTKPGNISAIGQFRATKRLAE